MMELKSVIYQIPRFIQLYVSIYLENWEIKELELVE